MHDIYIFFQSFHIYFLIISSAGSLLASILKIFTLGKILQLTSMKGDRFTSCQNIVSRSQTSSVPSCPQDSINKFITRKFNPLVLLDFRFISAFLHA